MVAIESSSKLLTHSFSFLCPGLIFAVVPKDLRQGAELFSSKDLRQSCDGVNFFLLLLETNKCAKFIFTGL
jgi:hypothetical protein